MKITLTRAEGPSEQCGKPVVCNSFYEAHSTIQWWNCSVAKGSYDKVDFKITDEANDFIYSGRYDMQHWSARQDSLRQQVISYLEYCLERANDGQEEKEIKCAIQLVKDAE